MDRGAWQASVHVVAEFDTMQRNRGKQQNGKSYYNKLEDYVTNAR